MPTGKAIQDSYAPKTGIQKSWVAKASIQNSLLNEVNKVGKVAITGAASALALGNALQPSFNLGWTLIGAVSGAALKEWQIHRSIGASEQERLMVGDFSGIGSHALDRIAGQ